MKNEKPVIVVDLELFEDKLKKLERLETENAQLKDTIETLCSKISKWGKGEYVSSKTAEKSFEMRDKLLKEKDHRIAVLERAIYFLAYYTPCDRCPIGKYKCKGGQDCENQLKQYFIKQAEKQLEEKRDET